MLFTRATNFDHNSVHLYTKTGSEIERVTEHKYLGIWLDEDFSFKYHINELILKLRQKIGFLYRNKSWIMVISSIDMLLPQL